ncbi:peptidase U32 family protein [Acanthopleuribacter pedis]|uniref:U32 family peptidase n=1 Tax=Acanthopleuribacter pedis TaxID=442870 RepID=A0A8J7QAD1_9BACT|nr:peptidase U32 family protein [Acanthopleuribacter pedis]MBO1320394.1 U32 family peptidase [Acanthopleuribacter pedis]
MLKTEILAPAGNMAKMQTAIRYGADAVYLAGPKFGLRTAADNFSSEQIGEACAFAHQHGAKVYVVLNGFLFDEDLADLPPFLADLENAGVDAVIVSDLGVMATVARHSKLVLHLSTQASALNTQAAKFWRDQGVKRLVLGREVTIEEAARIRHEADVEVELFGHGAMCMAYSGNCTISNYTAGRDSNRGGCIQSCRFKYRMSDRRGGAGDAGYFLSSKDLQGVAVVDQFVAQSIDSLKIEGRMKSELYVATTVQTYTAARDAAWLKQSGAPVEALMRELNSMSHRDYTSGSLVQKAGADSVYLHEDDHLPHSHDLMGSLIEVTDSHMTLFTRNPLVRGEMIEMLVPRQGVVHLETEAARDITGKAFDRVSSNRVILLPKHPAAQVGHLLRKKRHAPNAETHPQLSQTG